MPSTPAICGQCGEGFRYFLLNTGKTGSCPHCHEKMLGWAYPAWYQDRKREVRIESVGLDQAHCFFHEGKKAADLCSSCGRFLCSVCEIKYAGKIVCPDCIAANRAEGVSLTNSAPRHDRLALLLALLPLTLVFWFLAFVTAPLALFISVRNWNKRETLVPFSRWRYAAAATLAALQIAAFFALVFKVWALPAFE